MEHPDWKDLTEAMFQKFCLENKSLTQDELSDLRVWLNDDPRALGGKWKYASYVKRMLETIDTLRQENERLRQQSWNTGEAWRCEQHPDKTFPHGDCIGPGMPDYQGRSTIKDLRLRILDLEEMFQTELENKCKYRDAVDSLRLRLARMELVLKEISRGWHNQECNHGKVALKALEEDSHEDSNA